MNPRMRRLLQRVLAVVLFFLGVLVVVLAFLPVQYPRWFVDVFQWLWLWQGKDNPLWPRVVGVSPSAHYSARILLTIALGLTIFLPQVEVTFVSMLRRQSPIGAKYVDRKDFTCPNCGAVNRPGVQFCVKCGTAVYSGTKLWDEQPAQAGRGLTRLIKLMLLVAAIMAFFLGLFDLTIFSLLTQFLGTTSGSVLFATVMSTFPSMIGYVALKEGVLRRFGSFRRFDRIVFGNIVWAIFGMLFLLLFAYTFLGPPLEIVGSILVMWIQLVLVVLLLIHPLLRKRVSKTVPVKYP